MIFKELQITNFMSWEDASVNFEKEDLVFVTGLNGAGKSSLFDALCWGCFGRTTKNILADDVVSNFSNKGTKIHLQLSVNNKEVSITRYRKHKAHGNKIHVTINGSTIAQQSGVQEVINSLLQCDYDKFTQTIFFSQGNARYFTSLTEADQRKILSDLFNFNLFKASQIKTRKILRDLVTDAAESNIQYKYLKGLYSDSKKRIKKIKRMLNNSEIIEDNKRLELLSDRQGLSYELEECKTREENIECLLKVQNINKEKSKSLKETIQELTNERKILRSKNNYRSCLMCGTSLSDKKILKIIATINSKIDKNRTLLDSIEETEDIVVLSSSLQGIRKNIERIIAKSSEIATLLSKGIVDVSSITGLLKEEELSVLSRKRETIKELNILKKKQKKCLFYEFWDEGFGSKGLELFALQNAVPLFNTTVNSFLEYLPTEKGIIKTNFTFSGGHFKSKLTFSGSSKYAGASGGERRRVDLCVSLALMRLSGLTTNVLLLDEPFEGLDDFGISGVISLLKDLKVGSVFVTSHSSEFRSRFQNVWKVGIKDSKSVLENEIKGSRQLL